MSKPLSFLDVMRGPMYGPGGPAVQPPADQTGVDRAKIWQDAISGRAPQAHLDYDRVGAAKTWMNQPFLDATEKARKAIVDQARAADLAAGASANERSAAPASTADEHAALIAAQIVKVLKAKGAQQEPAQAQSPARQASEVQPQQVDAPAGSDAVVAAPAAEATLPTVTSDVVSVTEQAWKPVPAADRPAVAAAPIEQITEAKADAAPAPKAKAGRRRWL